MTKSHLVQHLPNHLIDLFVAKAEGVPYMQHADHVYRCEEGASITSTAPSGRVFPYAPSVDWRSGGPIIHKNGISIRKEGDSWLADYNGAHGASGLTPLIAAMRTRVRMAYGDAVTLEG